MSEADYSGHYDPMRNPNSSMLRVLAYADYEIRDLHPSMGGTHRDGFWVKVELPKVTGKLLRESETAGFSLVHVHPASEDTIEALFRTND